MEDQLCPAQRRAFDELMSALPVGHVFGLGGDPGLGKTTVLRQLHDAAGGVLLTMKDYLDALRGRHPLALEEAFEQMVREALAAHDCVLLDDFHLLHNVVAEGCGSYPRSGFLNVPLAVLTAYAAASDKKLIFAYSGYLPAHVAQQGYVYHIRDLEAADYECLCGQYLGPGSSARLDYAKVHRFAPRLNAHQLKTVCVYLRRDEALDTERFIDFLRSHHLTSNVDLGEVQPVTLADLKGVDEVIRSLETHIILPLENDELAAELGLKPKRGVLLVGPPGTGKTTVGRALAHRLKSKFFLLDGTCISGTNQFYGQVHYIFHTAQQNAPSILFVDDSDAIFESGQELGLYRYLLTMLDGLESASAGRVCVMLTAMDVGHLPPALLRSGRIELWLEMRLPDEAARETILRSQLATLPPAVGTVDLPRLAAATSGFTGADLKRLAEDGKNLLAHDKAGGLSLRPLTEYFLTAVEAVRSNKERYAEAEARARQQHPTRPVYFDAVNGA